MISIDAVSIDIPSFDILSFNKVSFNKVSFDDTGDLRTISSSLLGGASANVFANAVSIVARLLHVEEYLLNDTDVVLSPADKNTKTGIL